MPRLHTHREYEGELRRIREMLLMMGAKVEEMLSQAMKALATRDTALAEKTLYIDRQINRLEIEVDDLCLRVLARRQPVASDLRFLTMALKVVTDLERMGDLGVNICERVMELNEEPPLESYHQVVNMAEAAQEMLREALDAFVAGDAERAQAIVKRDSNVDAYYATIFRELLTYMMENPRNIFRATRDFPVGHLDAEHHEILQACVARDPERAAAAVRDHLQRTVDRVAEHLEGGADE